MRSDLPGNGPLDPGVDQLLRTLTSAATTDELAGEQDAMAMFRANVVPPGGTIPDIARGAGHPARPRPGRGSWLPVRWSIRLAAAATLALGGAAAAAYASALPSPVQHLAHTVLGFAGVPDSPQSGPGGGGRGLHHHGVAAGQHSASPGQSQPTSSLPPGASAGPGAGSPTVAAGVGPLLLSATATSGQITAGAGDVIDGQLTRAGAGVPGMTVTLYERPAGQRRWHVIGTSQTNSTGKMAVSVPALTENAVFRLAVPGGALSRAVVVTVTPPISAALVPSAGGASLVISTQFAHRGDLVVIQILAPDGRWRYLRSKRLDSAGQATFDLAAGQLRGRELRAVLVPTPRHAASVSNIVTVGP
jgi:hypothetical protein